MPSITTEVEFEVWCSVCGKGLCRYTEECKGGIRVDPCPDCMKEAFSEGYTKGNDEGGGR